MKATPVDFAHDLVVIGLPLRTSPEAAAKDIPGHWQKFRGEGIAAKVAAKKDHGYLYAVYCDYESDFRGPYTMVLGLAVEPTAPVPPGLRRVRIPAGKYASFAAQGDPAQAIWGAWTHVNSDWKDRVHRRYIADFERYVASSMSMESVEAEVVVGLA
jgi:predicted transcriptional regulator YdeE